MDILYHFGRVIARPGRLRIIAVWQTGSIVYGVHAGDELQPGAIVAVSTNGGRPFPGDEIGILIGEGWTRCKLKRFTLPTNGLVGITPGPEGSVWSMSLFRPDDEPYNTADEDAELL